MTSFEEAEKVNVGTSGRTAMFLAGVIVLVFAFADLAALNPPPKPMSSSVIAAKIDNACRKEFGGEGDDAVNRCRLRLYMENIAQIEKEDLERREKRLDAARREADN
jgi:hypothetical protein